MNLRYFLSVDLRVFFFGRCTLAFVVEGGVRLVRDEGLVLVFLFFEKKRNVWELGVCSYRAGMKNGVCCCY